MSRAHCFLLLITLLLSPLAPAAAAELKIAVAMQQPPFAMQTADGTLSGFDVDIAHALCDSLQRPCRLQAAARRQLLPLLASGAVDAVMGVSAAAKDGVFLSQRYYKNIARFAGRKNQSGKIAYKRMAGRTVAVVQDTLFDTFLGKKFPGVIVRRAPTLAAAYQALNADEVDYVLADRAEQHWLASQYKDYEVKGPKYSTARYFPDVVIAARNQELQTAINTALTQLRENGTYQQINDQHFPFDIYHK